MLQMILSECSRHWKPTASFFSRDEKFPFSQYWPSGVIRIGSPVWKCKSWKNIKTKLAEWAANGPVWMAQALKTLSLIQFWCQKNSLFPLLALWGNKNWLPSMKVKKLENYQNKIGLKDCKWSSLNAPGTQNPLSHSFLELDELSFCHN